MKINLNTLLDKFKTWREAKATEHNKPLSAESAYTISAINKDTTLETVYYTYKREILQKIKDSAKYKNIETYIVFPEHTIAAHKDQLIEDLTNLGYSIPYISDKSIIVNWETK